MSRSCPVFQPDAQRPALPTELQAHVQRMRELRPGLHMHSDDAMDAQDLTASGDMQAGLRIVVLLEGMVDVSYGARRVALSSTPRARAPATRAPQRPQALLVSVAEAERFERRTRRGRYARRLSVGLGGEWLAHAAGALGGGALQAFMGQHLALHAWQPSARVVALAEQSIRTPDLNPLLLHLYLESRALEIVGEALGSLQPPACTAPAAPPRLRPQEHRRMQALHAFLQRDEALDLSLDEIARQAGMNPSTLQRHFRAVHGTTVFDFVRESRLQRARHALERDGLSVGQAALLAGYNSAANFATAYRRRFGMPPRLARACV